MATRRVESFLLRIVVSEDRPLIPERWRGKIQHITTGAERQIDELSQVVAFINTHLYAPAEPDPSNAGVETPCFPPFPRQS
ncbi:MAG: hypothetical protein N2378_19165 [Chloroflexaceae bacterium]|nr:hypothetical protein [Chloroflexaceae bacterium]